MEAVKKLLILLGTVGNVFFGKRGDGMWFGWANYDDHTKSSDWSWIYPFEDWNVEYGVQLRFPLLGALQIFVHKETGQTHINFQGFTPKEFLVEYLAGEDRVTVKVTDNIRVRCYIDRSTHNFMIYVERGPDKISFALTDDANLLTK